MKLTEQQAQKIMNKVLNFLEIEIERELEHEAINDFIMLELINLELNDNAKPNNK